MHRMTLLGLLVGGFLALTLWLGRGGLEHSAIPLAMQSLGLGRSQTEQLHEVADLMLEIYETLARMTYLDPAEIQRGPHNITELLPLYEELGLDDSVIYLYSILPYISPEAAGVTDFFHGGSFVDFRNQEDVEESRDPFYGEPEGDDFDAENGPYMRPWVTPLSRMGNHQSVILYDTRRHRIWIIDQESWDSTDPALENVEAGEPHSKNRNSFEYIPSRPADEVLRDINRWYLSLDVLPGGGEYSGLLWSDEQELRALYRAHGWPDRFNGDAFQIAQVRTRAVSRAKSKAESPLEEVAQLKSHENYMNSQHQRALEEWSAAANSDEKWTAKFKLWQTGRTIDQILVLAKKAETEAARLCPRGVCQKKEDLPLWEMETLREEYLSKQQGLEHSSGDDEDSVNAMSRDQREAELYRKAYEAAKADAERLCPGRTLGRPREDTSLIDKEIDKIATLQKEMDALTEWATQMPKDALKAWAMVETEIRKFRQGIQRAEEMKQRLADFELD